MHEPLSPADASSLQAERGPVNMAVGGLLVFEPGDGTRYEAVAERVAARLHLVPRYRHRLEAAPLGIANPAWVDDGDFDLHWHLRRVSVDGETELAGYVAREMSRRLDRSRPLWELHVIEGLEGGGRALWAKMHHALVDGLAAVGIGMVLLDPTPEPMELAAGEEWHPRRPDRRAQLARVARLPLARAQQLLVDSTLRALDMSPRRAAEDLRRASDLLAELARQRPQAPMSPLNQEISSNRRYAMRSVALDRVKTAGRRLGGTVNDVLLAVVSGALARALPELRGELVALVPVSIRQAGEAGGNRISLVFVDLPTREPDLAARVARVGAQMRALRESSAVRAGALLIGATGAMPPMVSSVLTRALGNVRANNLVVSNVPGPQQPFYLNGTRLSEVFPAVPLNPANQGLTIGILSYDGGVNFGLLADAELDPGVDAIAGALDAALQELS